MGRAPAEWAWSQIVNAPAAWGGFGQSSHVVPAAGPVVDLGQHQHRDALVKRAGDVFRGRQPEFVAPAERSDQPVDHVEIRGEVAVVREDDAPLQPHLQGGSHRLVDLEGQCVAHHHSAGPARRSAGRCDRRAGPADPSSPRRSSRGSASRPIRRGAGARPARAPPAAAGRGSCRRGRSPRRGGETSPWFS